MTEDTLRAVLAGFAPRIRKMSTDERATFNATVARKLKGVTQQKREKNSYLAIKAARDREHDGRELGEKIMKERNANRRV